MKSDTTKQPLVENSEIQYLQNAADDLGLTVHEKFNQDKRQTIKKYFAQKGSETVSPVLDYEQLNHFLLGYRKAVNERKALLDSHKQLLWAIEQLRIDAEQKLSKTDRLKRFSNLETIINNANKHLRQ